MINRKRVFENPMPTVDESWWETVLAEEGSHSGHTAARDQASGGGRKAVATDVAARVAPDWDRAKQLYATDQIVSLPVISCNRGGLIVEGADLAGFVPFSHLVAITGQADAADRGRLMEAYVGRTLQLKVIECAPEDGRIVFSERAAQAEPGRRQELFQTLSVGGQAIGTVTNITDFGVFVDLGGVEGLIHISELSWGRVAHPRQIVQIGQTITVEVLDLAPERCRVALSLKRLLPNPWLEIGPELTKGPAVPAVVTSVMSYGAFARLDCGVEGLIHASEMPLTEGQSVRDLLADGQTVEVRVIHVDAEHQRMGLSMKTDR